MKNGFVVPLHINNNALPQFFFAVVLHFFFLLTRPLFLCCHVACYHRRDKWGARGGEEASGARVLASSPLPLIASVPALALSPPSYRLPEWQPAASRVQWACQPPRCGYLPTDLRKIHIWMWLSHACCGCLSRIAALPSGRPEHMQHTLLPHRALRPLKHATVHPFKWIPWDRPEAEAMRAAHHKNSHRARPVERNWSLKKTKKKTHPNNYIWTVCKFQLAILVKGIKMDWNLKMHCLDVNRLW